MDIKSFIQIYDEVLPWKTLSNLIRYINKINFKEAMIVGDSNNEQIDFNIRKTYNYSLSNVYSKNMTDVHWASLLTSLFNSKLFEYKNKNKVIDFTCKQIIDIQILKYENTGFYTWHTDHCGDIPRTMSCVLLLNNDYDGGNLCFRNPDGSEEWKIDVKPNRLIIWPSNFLYPHAVKPVTKGKRYSIVGWAL
jgi:predicted 2-oxoglutarate/Fe(II)-dependent dioxygenase YbiX